MMLLQRSLDVLPICLKGDVEQTLVVLVLREWSCGPMSVQPPDSAENSLPKEVWIKITLVSNIASLNRVAYDLMYTLDDGIQLQIPGGDQLALDTNFVVESCGDLCSKLFAPVHADLGRPWVARESVEF
jgi:hypothetical protein